MMRRWTLPTLAALALVTACGSSETARFYTLGEMTDARKVATAPGVVTIGPVELPPYLERNPVVVRSSPYRVEVAEFDRWAEPLEQATLRVLTENISALLGSDQVYANPRRRRDPQDLVVTVEFTRFEATSDDVVLAARWSIYRGEQGKPLAEGKAQVTRPGTSEDSHEKQARLMSEALGELSVTIAEAIGRL